ncbi:MAG: VPLPA-CTERM sorting domain-containing protein [Thiohalobacteraceae bacterium]
MSWKTLGVILVAAGVSGLPATGTAASYAISVNQISNFSMSFAAGSGTLSGFTFSNSAAATEGGGSAGLNTSDAPASCLFCAFNNQFFAHSTAGDGFSYGDALIASADVAGGVGSASAIAESYALYGTAYATGSNQLTSMSFSVAAGSQINFGFDANLIMETWLSAGGQSALAQSAMQITLSNASGTVFDWSPAALNRLLGANESDSVNGYFATSTGVLAGGAYTLRISMEQLTNVSAVPVPAAAWLLGSGLVGIVAVARRRNAK